MGAAARPSRAAALLNIMIRTFAKGVLATDTTGTTGLESATKKYGSGEASVVALDDVSISFETGAFTAIMGPSGSGKSTLMQCAAGLDRLSSGTVRISGVELNSLSDRDLTLLRRSHVGFVFQGFNLVSTLSALENIRLPLELSGREPDPRVLTEVVEALGLGSRLAHRPSELSGGQQQRVAVARALVAKPALIFADEPTGNLDTRAGSDLLQYLKTASQQSGQTIVMVTHDPVAATFADRVVFLRDGRLVDELFSPTADQVMAQMRLLGRA